MTLSSSSCPPQTSGTATTKTRMQFWARPTQCASSKTSRLLPPTSCAGQSKRSREEASSVFFFGASLPFSSSMSSAWTYTPGTQHVQTARLVTLPWLSTAPRALLPRASLSSCLACASELSLSFLPPHVSFPFTYSPRSLRVSVYPLEDVSRDGRRISVHYPPSPLLLRLRKGVSSASTASLPVILTVSKSCKRTQRRGGSLRGAASISLVVIVGPVGRGGMAWSQGALLQTYESDACLLSPALCPHSGRINGNIAA